MTDMVSQPTAKDRTLSIHQEHELLARLEKAGLSKKLAQNVIDSKDNRLAKKIIALIENAGYAPSTKHKVARRIMGKNFYGIEEVVKCLRINPPDSQIFADLREIPFSEQVLDAHKDTHILIAHFPLSLQKLWDICYGKDKDQKILRGLPFNFQQSRIFDKSDSNAHWRLVRKKPIENSVSKNWDEQKALLSKNEEVPGIEFVVYIIICHFLATGERLLEDVLVRCINPIYEYRSIVGNFDDDGVKISAVKDYEKNKKIGLLEIISPLF